MAYQNNFLGEDLVVDPPKIGKHHQARIKDLGIDLSELYLDYNNFSLLQNPVRRFPFYTIANINGSAFRSLPRKDSWKNDKRIEAKYQWGSALYAAEKSDFDKGHMTKREDVQWGKDDDSARAAAESTFFYTNAVPQVDKLNRGIWSKIEKYILHAETVKQDRKITLLTGPVLDDDDPVFVTEVSGSQVKIPTLFWKVVYYTDNNQQLYRTAFIVNQKNILESRKIVKPTPRSKQIFLQPFMDFEDAETYQTGVQLVEELTGLNFHPADEVYQEERPTQLVVTATEVQGKSLDLVNNLTIKNLQL